MKTILGVLIGCAALLVIAYGIGVFYYSGHFLSGTEINGVDCSGKTVAEAEESIESQIASYQLVLKEREDKSETISASDQYGVHKRRRRTGVEKSAESVSVVFILCTASGIYHVGNHFL